MQNEADQMMTSHRAAHQSVLSVIQTFPVSSLHAVAAGPVSGVQLQPRTFPVSPSGATQPAADHLKPAATNSNITVTGANRRSSNHLHHVCCTTQWDWELHANANTQFKVKVLFHIHTQIFKKSSTDYKSMQPNQKCFF